MHALGYFGYYSLNGKSTRDTLENISNWYICFYVASPKRSYLFLLGEIATLAAQPCADVLSEELIRALASRTGVTVTVFL